MPQLNDDELDKIREENELRKKKLEEELGAVYSTFETGEELDPEIENQFLKNIEEFERRFSENIPQIALYDFIGKPEMRKVETIPDSEIEAELEKLTTILDENQISVDTLCEVEARELYRFITEELFVHEVDNMHVPNMTMHFTYEEFHPNHEYDLTNYSHDFVRTFFDKNDEFYDHLINKTAKESKWFENFRNSFKSFDCKHFEIKKIEFDTEKATVWFTMELTGIIDGSNESQTYSGDGQFDFAMQYDYWYIASITLPPCTTQTK